LRYLPPVWFLMRRATTDVEGGGVRIPSRGLVMPWVGSAHRDSTQFPQPDRFDVTRQPNPHLGVGHGIHFFVGSPLTPLGTSIVLPMMLEQLKDVRVDRTARIGIHAGIVFVIANLPATFRAA